MKAAACVPVTVQCLCPIFQVLWRQSLKQKVLFAPNHFNPKLGRFLEISNCIIIILYRKRRGLRIFNQYDTLYSIEVNDTCHLLHCLILIPFELSIP